MPYSETTEKYLEAIYILSLRVEAVHITDIADAMGVAKPTVTQTVHRLQNKALLDHPQYGTVTLTDKGRNVAQVIYRRHQLLTDFIRNILQVDAAIAEEDACRIEHIISETTMDAVEAYLMKHRLSNTPIAKVI